MKTFDLIPEEIVSDFGVKNFIDENIHDCVEKLASYFGEERIHDSFYFIWRLIQIASNTKSFENSIGKYSPFFGKYVVSMISPYVLEYIRDTASKKGYSLDRIDFP